MANYGPLVAELGPVVWGTPANCHGFHVLAALLHGTPAVGVSQTAALNRGRHLYLAGRPSSWALAHILVLFISVCDYCSMINVTVIGVCKLLDNLQIRQLLYCQLAE